MRSAKGTYHLCLNAVIVGLNTYPTWCMDTCAHIRGLAVGQSPFQGVLLSMPITVLRVLLKHNRPDGLIHKAQECEQTCLSL